MGRKRLAKNRGFPPNLYQNPAGYFYYKDPHTKRQKGLGRDRAAAFNAARDANAALATIKPSSLVDWVLGKVDYTFSEWLPVYKELWIEKTAPAPATLRAASMYLNRLAESDLATMRLSNIGVAHIARCLSSIEAESGAPTANALRSRMQDIFRFAETQGLIEVGKNPVTATYTPNQSVKRDRLSLEQFKLIHAQASDWTRRAMDLALVTGQRRNDICNMEFSDVRDEHLHVEQEKSQGEVKLQLDLSIRLSAYPLSIGDAVAACRDLVVSRYLVHHTKRNGNSKPGQRVNANGLSNAFAAARDAAKIAVTSGRTPPSFHEIRSLSERLYKDEFGATFAQALLGHKTARMTAKYDDLRGGWKVVAIK